MSNPTNEEKNESIKIIIRKYLGVSENNSIFAPTNSGSYKNRGPDSLLMFPQNTSK